MFRNATRRRTRLNDLDNSRPQEGNNCEFTKEKTRRKEDFPSGEPLKTLTKGGKPRERRGNPRSVFALVERGGGSGVNLWLLGVGLRGGG